MSFVYRDPQVHSSAGLSTYVSSKNPGPYRSPGISVSSAICRISAISSGVSLSDPAPRFSLRY